VSVLLKLLHNRNKEFTNLYQCNACGLGFSDTIAPLTIRYVSCSGSETIAWYFACHSISAVFRFYLLRGRKRALTHVCASKCRGHF